jgi:hypothetical protein
VKTVVGGSIWIVTARKRWRELTIDGFERGNAPPERDESSF